MNWFPGPCALNRPWPVTPVLLLPGPSMVLISSKELAPREQLAAISKASARCGAVPKAHARPATAGAPPNKNNVCIIKLM